MARFLLGGYTPGSKHAAWLRECRLDFSHCLPPWPWAFALCRKCIPVLVPLLVLWSSAAFSKLCDFMCLDLGFLNVDRTLHLEPEDQAWSLTSSS